MIYLRLLIYIILIFYFAFAEYTFAQDSKIKIIVVAGQSNAMNWHSDAALLDSNTNDNNIMYYYHTGLPPSKGGPVPFNSTSSNQWRTLHPQTQNPYVKYFKNFFGPEIAIARELYSTIPNLAVIKCAYGGSNLAVDWKKGIGSGNQLYEIMMTEIDTATNILKQQGLDYEFIGFFWMQGESDASNLSYADSYESNLSNFIYAVRDDLNNPDLKFILGRIGINLPAPYDYKNKVRAAQMNVADLNSNVEWVDIDDLLLDTDNVHLLADGVKSLGYRMADAWKSITTNIQNEIANRNNQNIVIQNFPNPFNPTTKIRWHSPVGGWQTLKVYDVLGKEVKTLLNEYKDAGTYEIVFDANDLPAGRKGLTSGLYFYRIVIHSDRITSGSYSETRKMILMR